MLRVVLGLSLVIVIGNGIHVDVNVEVDPDGVVAGNTNSGRCKLLGEKCENDLDCCQIIEKFTCRSIWGTKRCSPGEKDDQCYAQTNEACEKDSDCCDEGATCACHFCPPPGSTWRGHKTCRIPGEEDKCSQINETCEKDYDCCGERAKCRCHAIVQHDSDPGYSCLEDRRCQIPDQDNCTPTWEEGCEQDFDCCQKGASCGCQDYDFRNHVCKGPRRCELTETKR